MKSSYFLVSQATPLSRWEGLASETSYFYEGENSQKYIFQYTVLIGLPNPVLITPTERKGVGGESTEELQGIMSNIEYIASHLWRSLLCMFR